MKKQLDIKKLLLLNMPYILMGLFATNFGEGWRMAVGADASAKMLSFFSTSMAPPDGEPMRILHLTSTRYSRTM